MICLGQNHCTRDLWRPRFGTRGFRDHEAISCSSWFSRPTLPLDGRSPRRPRFPWSGGPWRRRDVGRTAQEKRPPRLLAQTIGSALQSRLPFAPKDAPRHPHPLQGGASAAATLSGQSFPYFFNLICSVHCFLDIPLEHNQGLTICHI